MHLKYITKSVFILILLFSFINSFSQKPPKKFGKVSRDDFEMQYCPIDSNAHAYYIFDYGNSYFKYAETVIRSNDPSDRKGFQLYFTRHFRIKIIDNQSFDLANIEIPIYHDGDSEKISRLKAVTYNLEDGKVVKSKLDKSNIFIEKTSKHWDTRKFAMPNVREGSIIEVTYTIISDFYFNLQPWYFQKSIPVLQSEYHVSIPEYYNYHVNQWGYFLIKTEKSSSSKSLNLTYERKAQGGTVSKQTYKSSELYTEEEMHFYLKNITTFPDEKYIKSKNNYLSKVTFELSSTNFPNSMSQTFSTTWKKINHDLNQSYSFGNELINASHLEADISLLKLLYKHDYSRINGAFNLLKNKLTWNGHKSKYVDKSLKYAYKHGGGNSADINLNLVLLLRNLGYISHPVILSTQDNGIIHPSHPTKTKFNYVIALVIFEDKTYLLDATDRNSEINLLPIRCLNDKGFIINGTGGDWIDLMNINQYSYTSIKTLTLDTNLLVSGKNELKLEGFAYYYYKKYLEGEDQEKELREYIEERENIDNGIITIDEISIPEFDSIVNTIYLSYNLKANNLVENNSEIALFCPTINPFVTENPFKLESREYPIEFNSPIAVLESYSYTIPDNYEVSELPKPIVIKLPDNSAKFVYNINQIGNTVNLTLILNIKKTMFLPNEYLTVKNFYQLIVDKQNELIVLNSVK